MLLSRCYVTRNIHLAYPSRIIHFADIASYPEKVVSISPECLEPKQAIWLNRSVAVPNNPHGYVRHAYHRLRSTSYLWQTTVKERPRSNDESSVQERQSFELSCNQRGASNAPEYFTHGYATMLHNVQAGGIEHQDFQFCCIYIKTMSLLPSSQPAESTFWSAYAPKIISRVAG